MTGLVGRPVEPSAAPLEHPWSGRLDGRLDGALARTLGFRPSVPTIHSAVEQGIL